MNAKRFPLFINFIETLFCQTYSSNELAKQVGEYNKFVPRDVRKSLKKEVMELQTYPWEKLQYFMRKNTSRWPRHEKDAIFLLQTILDNLDTTYVPEDKAVKYKH